MICPICERGKLGVGNSYVHCPAYGLVHMSHCTKDKCPYHRNEISTDWCRYKKRGGGGNVSSTKGKP